MRKLLCDEKDLSIGLRILFDYADKRQLHKLWEEKYSDDVKFTYVFSLCCGKYKFPSLNFIYKSLPLIDPQLWFYKVNTTPPETILSDANLTTDITESINFKKMEEMFFDGSLKELCVREKRDFGAFYHIIKRYSSVTPQRMDLYRNEFPIKNWFIK